MKNADNRRRESVDKNNYIFAGNKLERQIAELINRQTEM
jgi:hypothetical protein